MQQMTELLQNQNLLPVSNDALFRFMSNKEVFEALLANGANPNYNDSYFKFPILSLAYSHGHYQAFKLLLEYGADPNVPSTIRAEKTDLLFDLFFSYVKNKKYVDVLAKNGINFNVILPDTGETLLEWMLRYYPLATDALKTILENGGDPNLPNRHGKNIFELAESGDIRVISSLMPLLEQLRK